MNIKYLLPVLLFLFVACSQNHESAENTSTPAQESTTVEDDMKIMTDSRAYEDFARAFIAKVPSSTADDLLKMFSPAVIEASGNENAKNWLTNEVIPFFKNQKELDGNITTGPANNEFGSAGYGFYLYSIMNDGAKVPIVVYVFKEKEQFVIGNVLLDKFMEGKHVPIN